MSKATHIFGLANSILSFTSKATVASVKLTFLPGLRTSVRLGLSIPTPDELRLMAAAIATADIKPAVNDLYQATTHASVLCNQPQSVHLDVRFFLAFEELGKVLAQLLFATANAFEKEPVKNYTSYFRAVHVARTEIGTHGFMPLW